MQLLSCHIVSFLYHSVFYSGLEAISNMHHILKVYLSHAEISVQTLLHMQAL